LPPAGLAVAIEGMKYAIALALAMLAPVQDREPVTGRVERSDGKPWAGARVTLFSRLLPGIPELGDGDRVVVATDARGRFRAALLPGRRYSVWATGVARNGTRLTTKIAEDVGPGRPIRLVEDTARARWIELEFRGLAAFRRRFASAEPPFVRIVTATENAYIERLRVPDNGKLRLPTLPGRHAWLEICAGDGRPVAVQRLRVTAALTPDELTAHKSPLAGLLKKLGESLEARRKELGPAKKPDAVPIQLPLGVDASVRVVDEAKHPIAGAKIDWRVRVYDPLAADERSTRGHRVVWSTLGKTDADGWCDFSVAEPAGRKLRLPVSLRIAAAGHTTKLVVHALAETREAGGRITRAIQVALPRSAPVRGKLEWSPGKPVSGMRLVASSWLIGRNRRPTDLVRTIVTTDRSGAFAIDGLGPGAPCFMLATADRDQVTRLSGNDERLLPLVQLGVVHAPARAEGRVPTIDLSKLRPLRLQITNADGSPVRHPLIHVVPSDRELFDRWHDAATLSLIGSRRGRANVLLGRGGHQLLVLSQDGFARASVPERSHEPLRLALTPWLRVRGQVVDSDGKPASGAVIESRGFYRQINSKPLDTWITRCNQRRMATITDANGKFELLLIPHANTVYLTALTWTGPTLRVHQQTVEISPDADRNEELLITIQ